MRWRVIEPGSRDLDALQLHSPAWHRPKPPVSPRRSVCSAASRAAPVSAGFPAQGPRCALLPPCALLTAVRSLAVAWLPPVPGAGPEPCWAGEGGRAQRKRLGWARLLLTPQQVSPTFLTARFEGGGAGELWGNHAWEKEETTASKLRSMAPPSLTSVPQTHTQNPLFTPCHKFGPNFTYSV